MQSSRPLSGSLRTRWPNKRRPWEWRLTRNADEVPAGDDWLHEIKYDGFVCTSMAVRAKEREAKGTILTSTGVVERP